MSTRIPTTRKKKGPGNNVIMSGDGKCILYQDTE
jgi:hypothetical protein